MNQMYGFEGEVKAKYTAQMFQLFSEVFQWLPLAQCINNKVLVSSGHFVVFPMLDYEQRVLFDILCFASSTNKSLHLRLCTVDCLVKTVSHWKTSGRLTGTGSLQTQVGLDSRASVKTGLKKPPQVTWELATA